jgi:hypothetical protein
MIRTRRNKIPRNGWYARSLKRTRTNPEKPRLNIRLTKEQWAFLDEISQDQQCTAGETIRKLLDDLQTTMSYSKTSGELDQRIKPVSPSTKDVVTTLADMKAQAQA